MTRKDGLWTFSSWSNGGRAGAGLRCGRWAHRRRCGSWRLTRPLGHLVVNSGVAGLIGKGRWRGLRDALRRTEGR